MADATTSPSRFIDREDEVEGRYIQGWEAEQEERLLQPNEISNGERDSFEIGDDLTTKKSKYWVLKGASCLVPIRTLLVLALCLVFLGMVSLQVWAAVERLQMEHSAPKPTFRRPQSDYILDHKWLFGVQPMKRVYRWTISDQEVNPDGVYRSMILINGQFPGPLIECNEGDTLSIEIDNQSVNATSLHWHGIYQNGTNWMDGTVGVTQCAIAPGGKFKYEFTVTGQSGTYWLVSYL